MISEISKARVTAITSAINQLTDDYKRKLAVVERLNVQLEGFKADEKRIAAEQEVQEKAHVILLKLEEIWRKDFEKGIEQIVTDGINLIFGVKDAFVIETKVERGASAVEFNIETQDGAVTDVSEAEGNSLKQVVSFLLRVILIKASRPPLRQVTLLDENFVGIDEEKVALVGLLMHKVVYESGVQIIATTHYRRIIEYADVVYEVYKEKDAGRVRRLEVA